MSTKPWPGVEGFGKQAGSFPRRLLEVEPGPLRSFVSLLAERVEHAGILRLLDPFLQANEFPRTRDLGVLEQ